MDADDRALQRLLSATQSVLRPLEVRRVEFVEVVNAGSGRSRLVRAIGDRAADPPLDLILKMPVGVDDSLGRELAGLTLVRDYKLPGAVNFLGVVEEPMTIILEDLGRGPSVADYLLSGDPIAAERAVVDWATVLGRLHVKSAGLRSVFAHHLTRFAGSQAPVNLNQLLLGEARHGLMDALAPYGLEMPAAALAELDRLLATDEPLPTRAEPGLVPGDCCPDNAIYGADGLTLIDFESASYRPAAWDACYLTVPWPTCWCSWTIPAEVSEKALGAWSQAAGTSTPFSDEDLTAAEICWATITLASRLPRITDGSDTAAAHNPARLQRPDSQAVLLHRLGRAATADTSQLPNLRALAETVHANLATAWGQQPLPLAPAFREAKPRPR